MGRVHIWIRKEDESAWAAIKNKPEWLHEHLNNQVLPVNLVAKFIEESGALETESTLRQFVEYCESLSSMKDGSHEL